VRRQWVYLETCGAKENTGKNCAVCEGLNGNQEREMRELGCNERPFLFNFFLSNVLICFIFFCSLMKLFTSNPSVSYFDLGCNVK